MRKHWPIIAILVGLFSILMITEFTKPPSINWEPSYSKYHRRPFGAMALYESLSDLFPDKTIETIHEPAYMNLSERYILDEDYEIDLEKTNLNPNYIFLKSSLYLDLYDAEELLNYVKTGNTVFIAAERLDRYLSDSLGINVQYTYTHPDSFFGNILSDTTYINFTDPSLKMETAYLFDPKEVGEYFSDFDHANTVVLGEYENGHPNFIRVEYGEGFFFLNSTPKAFTNYNLLNHGNDDYIAKAFSYLPKGDIYWDEYYKVGRDESRSPLRFILSDTSLKWAYTLTLLFIVLYIFFVAKRTQRIIPVIKPLKNTSVEFAQTVGRLYFQKADHKDLAKKKALYFLDFIRGRYYLSKIAFNEDLYRILSAKSGIEIDKVKQLMETIKNLTYMTEVSEDHLHFLNTKIEEFHKNCL